MKNQIFIQARTNSTRLPKKILLKIYGKSIIELIFERLQKIKDIDKIVLVTSEEKTNNELVKQAKKLGLDYFQGSEENVLDRFYQASCKFKPDNIIRITGDCPLIDSDLINQGLEVFEQGNYDILSNARIRTFPDGMDFEIFKKQALSISWKDNFLKFNKNKEKFDKIFINPIDYLLTQKKFKNKDFINKKDLSRIRLTLDYKEDFELIEKIYKNLYEENKYFDLNTILEFLKSNPNLYNLNKKHICLDYGLGINKII